MNIEFDSQPVYGDGDKYIKTKIKMYGNRVNTNFQGKKVPKENVRLLLQTLASNLHLNLLVLCHFMCLASLAFEIKLNTLTFVILMLSGTHILAYGSLNCLCTYFF